MANYYRAAVAFSMTLFAPRFQVVFAKFANFAKLVEYHRTYLTVELCSVYYIADFLLFDVIRSCLVD